MKKNTWHYNELCLPTTNKYLPQDSNMYHSVPQHVYWVWAPKSGHKDLERGFKYSVITRRAGGTTTNDS